MEAIMQCSAHCTSIFNIWCINSCETLCASSLKRYFFFSQSRLLPNFKQNLVNAHIIFYISNTWFFYLNRCLVCAFFLLSETFPSLWMFLQNWAPKISVFDLELGTGDLDRSTICGLGEGSAIMVTLLYLSS